MQIVIKAAADIFPLSDESLARLERLKSLKDEDIDTSEMPELTNEQLTRMKPAHFIKPDYASAARF